MGQIHKSFKALLNKEISCYHYKCDRCDKPEQTNFEMYPIEERTETHFWNSDKDNSKNYINVQMYDKALAVFCLDCWEEISKAI